MAAELAFYKERYKEAEHECRVMKNQRRQIESVNETPKDITKILNQNTRQINNLKQRLEDRTNLERYLFISNTQCAMSTSQRLLTQFQMLKDQLPTVLVMDGAYEPPVGDLKGTSADLDDLLSTVFGRDALYNPDDMPGTFPALTSYELIQALTGASLHEWIFGSEYRTYAMGVTPLLQEYRKFVATLCDHESLCNLDIAVHQSIIEDDSFKDVIVPKMSEMFTSRLVNALEPLFDKDSRRNAIQKLRPSLYSILHLAIQIRSETLVSTDCYQLIWPSVGSSFNKKEMETKGTESIAVAGVVRLPLCPGIRAYTKEKALVDYGGLMRGDVSRMGPKYVMKALVLR
ncbi:hypothetical protein BU25DRAFT_166424 [Macroventuria anomochaeta]|uniref:Uncharacterized protein n=1 Tax=Macroventuria anomochaeta TaxID=301207 RepID=A0ACB6RPU2_9PLEO|nr:uncharacterized protein BU25DRAFT_166424 [Macroventuria anomochaeta]KAF2624066.1 hypothetical protein BU25DRAFT_166424 [Macroventuria anomochaeta]